MKNLRVAWLLTSAFYYWQPSLSCYSKQFPDTTVFTSRWHGFAPGLEDSFRVEILGDRQIISIKKSTNSYGDNFTYLPLNIVKRLLKFKPDLIFSNSFGVWTILAILFKPIGRWRVVIAYEGSSPGVDYRNSPLRLAIRRVMVKAADACITNSHGGKNYLIEVLNAQENQVFVHPYEVPWVQSLGTPNRDFKSTSSQQLTFLFVGGIIPRKGLSYLLEACAILQQQGETNYQLWVVGDGHQRPELETFCQQNQLTNYVRWFGRVEYHQLATYFTQADVFVLPTLEDTWGMVVLEAMVLGRPVLCSELAGASELITDGENGYCFHPQQPEYLAELMARFIQNPELAKLMGMRSQKLMDNYTPQAAANFLNQVTSFIFPNY